MVLRNSGRVGSRRFNGVLRFSNDPEDFFLYLPVPSWQLLLASFSGDAFARS